MDHQRTNHYATAHRQHDDWDDVHNQLLAIQKKSLEVSAPDDADEKEANEVAGKVVNGESAEINGSGSTINRKGEGAAETTPEFQTKLESSKGGGQPLDDSMRSEMESKMNADFSGVKIHTGSEAHVMNESVNAKAFTHGQDVFFRQGAFDTNSKQGKELLAHELVHTKQQAGNKLVQRAGLADIGATELKKTKIFTTLISGVGVKLSDAFDPTATLANFSFDPATVTTATNHVKFTGVNTDMEQGLRNVVASLIDPPDPTLALNYSATLNLALSSDPPADLTKFSAPSQLKFKQDIVYRFTRYTDTAGKDSVLVEELGPKTTKTLNADEKKVRKDRFDSYGFSVTGFSTDETDILYGAVAKVPDAILSKIKNIKFIRDGVNADPKVAGLYTDGPHTITIYDLAFASSITMFGDQTSGFISPTEQTIIHEIGHAVDKKGLNAASKEFFGAQNAASEAYKLYDEAYTAFEASVKKYYNSATKQYEFKSQAELDDFNKLKLQYKVDEFEKKYNELKGISSEKETTMSSVVSPSGAKKVLTGDTYTATETATDTAFRQAAVADGGIRITDYSDEAWAEYFAESFSFFTIDPNRMSLLRPKVYAYFKGGKHNE